MTPQLPGDLVGRLSGFATAQFGLRFPPDRWNELARGAASAALDLGVSDLEGWIESVVSGRTSGEHLAALANHLTISETYFFRHPETFTDLETRILPGRLAERRNTARALRIWSAGCASGEEPYSLAILLRHKFPDVRPNTVVITGTDINSLVLARATRGVYSEWSFRDAPAWLKPGYFTKISPTRFEVIPEIRHMVHFTALNLAAPFYPAEFGERGDFDVILCRNVLMYFSAEWQEKIIARFTAALAPHGWLIVGPCDITAAQSAALQLDLVRPGLYQKNPGGAAARAASKQVLAPIWAPEVDFVAPSPPSVPAESAREAPAYSPEPVADTTAAAASDVTEADAADHAAAADLAAQAHAHADRGDLNAALAACDEALAVNPTSADLHHLRACVLMELNRLPEAEADFRRVLYLEPDSAMAQFALGSIAQRAGRAEEARHHFHVLLRTLAKHQRGEAVPKSDGLTVARLREVVERTLNDHAA